jgi:hypothetical protein
MTSVSQLLPGNFFILGNLTFFSFSPTRGSLSPLWQRLELIDFWLMDAVSARHPGKIVPRWLVRGRARNGRLPAWRQFRRAIGVC